MDRMVKDTRLEKKIIITFDLQHKEVEIVANDFTTIESLGVLEAAKFMTLENWHKKNHS